MDQDFQPEQSESIKKTAAVSEVGKSILVYLHDLSYLIAGMMLVFLLLFRVVVVSGPSMNDTLIEGDYLLLIGSTFYSEPKTGDVVVAAKESFQNGVPIVKRVIATEGQTIDLIDGYVYVDGIKLEEEYAVGLSYPKAGTQFPLTVSPGCVFVMGDNRVVSMDSRDPRIGLLDEREILGKAIFLFLPGADERSNKRDFSRIGGMENAG